MARMHNPPHSGLFVKEYLDNSYITVTEAAKNLDITRAALSRIINGRIGISPEMALQLDETIKLFKAETWLKMQFTIHRHSVYKEKSAFVHSEYFSFKESDLMAEATTAMRFII